MIKVCKFAFHFSATQPNVVKCVNTTHSKCRVPSELCDTIKACVNDISTRPDPTRHDTLTYAHMYAYTHASTHACMVVDGVCNWIETRGPAQCYGMVLLKRVGNHTWRFILHRVWWGGVRWDEMRQQTLSVSFEMHTSKWESVRHKPYSLAHHPRPVSRHIDWLNYRPPLPWLHVLIL